MKYKVLDFHSHAFPDRIASKTVEYLGKIINMNPQYDGSFDGLKKSMIENGIDYSLVLPIVTNKIHTEHINDFAISVNKKFNDTGILSFGSIKPGYENYKNELKRLKENGIKGIKLHPYYQGEYIDSNDTIDIINTCFDLGLIVLFHAGKDPGFPNEDKSTIDHIVRMLCSINKNGTIVLAHLGSLFEWEEVLEQICGRYDNVYFDTGFCFGITTQKNGKNYPKISEDLFIKMVNKHGSDKILFGTDAPWGRGRSMVDFVLNSKLSEEDKEKILYLNAKKLLNL